MLFVKNVKLCEAECGENIWHFAKELVDYREATQCDLIGIFNGIYIEVRQKTKEDDIIRTYDYRLCK